MYEDKAAPNALRRIGRGFTLIELLVVDLIVGVLAAVAIPQYFKVVEQAKLSEFEHWLSNLKSAQERYLAKNGTYCVNIPWTACGFDSDLGGMQHYSAENLGDGRGGGPDWSVTVTRLTPAPAVYGAYAMTYIRSAEKPLSCDNVHCKKDLIP
jgi:prepilin-type N-terminal cleavage/methylation domain-containing protein